MLGNTFVYAIISIAQSVARLPNERAVPSCNPAPSHIKSENLGVVSVCAKHVKRPGGERFCPGVTGYEFPPRENSPRNSYPRVEIPGGISTQA